MELPTSIPINSDFLFQAGFVMFVIKEVWVSIKGKDREFETALQNNTIALVELRATLTSLSEKISDLSHRVRLLETEN